MIHPAQNLPVVSVSGRADVLAAVAALLGFHPASSLVLVCLTGRHHRIGPVVRVDLDEHTGQIPAEVTVRLLGYAARYADAVIVVTYSDNPPDTDDLTAGLTLVCPVKDVITAPNTRQDVPARLLAATVISGRAVLAGRAELARSVHHQQGLAPAPVLAELDTTTGRDALIARLLPDPDAVAVLVTAAQSVPDTDPRAADVCAALALLAYRHGNGALAQVAVDRALRTAPDHRLCHLLLAVMSCGMRPADLDALVTTQP